MNGKERASYVNWFLIAFSIVCLGLSLQPGKALVIDEFLHFAVGAYESTSEAWDIVRASIAGGINHGQTGAYMMVDYWLLRAFGANLFWLRFPSLLAGLLLYLAALHF